MPSVSRRVGEGPPYVISLSCGHTAIHNIAPPTVGDVILCYACGQGREVVGKEPVASTRTSGSKESKEKAREKVLSRQVRPGTTSTMGDRTRHGRRRQA